MADKKYFKEYYQKNKERIKLIHHQYDEKNKEKIKLRKQKYNKERYPQLRQAKILYSRDYYHNNKNLFKQYAKQYYQKNADHLKLYSQLYREENRDTVRLHVNQYKQRIRRELILLLGSICAICKTSEKIQIDHKLGGGSIDRRLKGGNFQMYAYYMKHPEEAKEKLQLLCSYHNQDKATKNKERSINREFSVFGFEIRPECRLDVSNRICLICKSNTTMLTKYGRPWWFHYKDGFACRRCHKRLKEREKKITTNNTDKGRLN